MAARSTRLIVLVALIFSVAVAIPAQPADAAPALVIREVPANIPKYDRDAWRHWIDANRDCQDTRQEVLIAESRAHLRLNASRCRVASGRWIDVYTGQRFFDPSDLDVDRECRAVR
jgi:hypothetical protein